MQMLIGLVCDVILLRYVNWKPHVWQTALLLSAIGLLAVLTR